MAVESCFLFCIGGLVWKGNIIVSKNLIIVPSGYEDSGLKFKTLQTGMGKVNCLVSFFQYISQHKNVKNVLLTGFCGGLRGLLPGQIMEPSILIQGDYDVRPLETYPRYSYASASNLFQFNVCPFVSQDRFLYNDPYKDISYNTLATDMESYALSIACFRFKVNLSIIKIVSDVVGENSHKDFIKNSKKFTPKLSKVIKMWLETV